MHQLIVLIGTAFCVAAITFTVAMTSIFKPFRERLSSIHEKIEELVHCPWCLSHWVAMILLLTSDIDLIIVSHHYVYNLLFTWFAVIGVVGVFHYVLLRAYAPALDAAVDRNMEQMMQQAAEPLMEESSGDSPGP